MARLENNLRLYGWHQALAGTLFWMPTVMLFLTEQVGLTTALVVQSAYYFAVVVLELPSGWLSDRIGRVIALRIVALAWMVAHVVFASAPGMVGLVVAQVLLAAGYAFLSGTDVTFHYDSLEALGREDEFEQREAAARQRLLLVTASSALVGGALGTVDLRLPFLASTAFAAAQGLITLRLTEPGATDANPAPDEATARTVFGYLRAAPLLWLALFIAAQVIAVHLVADLAGPYLAETTGDVPSEPRDAAFVTGATVAAAALIGAFVVRRVPDLRDRMGPAAVLLATAAVPLVVLGTMAAVTTPWVVPVLTLRGLPTAALAVLAPALVGRYVARRHRASYLSLASLGGRLGFGAVLFILGSADTSLATSLSIATAFVGAMWLVTAGLQRLAVDDSDFAPRPDETEPSAHRHLHVHWGSHDHRHPEAHGRAWGIHRHRHVHGPSRPGG